MTVVVGEHTRPMPRDLRPGLRIEGPARDRGGGVSGQALSRRCLVFHKVTINLLFSLHQKM